MPSEEFERITDNLREWRKGLENPEQAQIKVITSYLEDYVKTDYGKKISCCRYKNIPRELSSN
jgi:hypothetical protein